MTHTPRRILDDERHGDVVLVSCAGAAERLFPDRDMRDDPPPAWMWTREEVAAGAAREAAAAAFRAPFERLSREPRRAPATA